MPLLGIVLIAALAIVGAAMAMTALGLDTGVSVAISVIGLAACLIIAVAVAWGRRLARSRVVRLASREGFVPLNERAELVRRSQHFELEVYRAMLQEFGDRQLALALYVVLLGEYSQKVSRTIAGRMSPLAGLGLWEVYGPSLADVLRSFVPAAVKMSNADIPEFASAVARIGRTLSPVQVVSVISLPDPVYAVELIEEGVSPEYISSLVR